MWPCCLALTCLTSLPFHPGRAVLLLTPVYLFQLSMAAKQTSSTLEVGSDNCFKLVASEDRVQIGQSGQRRLSLGAGAAGAGGPASEMTSAVTGLVG